MATGKKSFIAYSDWKETFDALPNDKAGELIKHIFAYVNDEDPQTDDVLINAVFANIKNQLKRDLEKWDNQLEQRRAAGRKSAEKRKAKSNERSTVVNEKTRNPTDNVNVTVNVNDTDNVITKKSRAFAPPSLEQVQEYCKERNNSVNAETFIDFYSSKGWLVGKNKMKDWKASVRTWEKRKDNGQYKKTSGSNTAATSFNNETEKYDY